MPRKTRRRTKPPAYRQRPGFTQAIVTLRDAATGRARDFRLGEYGTPESRERYHRLIAEWEARDRRWPDLPATHAVTAGGSAITIDELLVEYRQWSESYYVPSHIAVLKMVFGVLRRYYGSTPAAEFGPNKMRLLRERMILGDSSSDRPRRPWARKSINTAMQRIRHVFKWAAARELVPASVYQSLCTLEPLKKGRTAARESPRIGVVAPDLLRRSLRFMSRPIRALVRLQLLTGTRAGELLALRACDLEIDDVAGVWTYKPEQHKNAFREHERAIYFGPRAQRILRRFVVGRPTTAYLFSPADADAERRARAAANRKTPLNAGNRPGTNRRQKPERRPGERYCTASYRRAIEYACERAFPPPEELARRRGESDGRWRARLKRSDRWEDLLEWRRTHRWHPHQLRHNAATLLRREFGLEAAQLALGHASAHVTDAVYAERDRAKVIEIMKRIG